MAERRSARLTPTNQSGTLTATTQKAQKVTTGPQQTTIPTQKTTSVAQRLDCSTPQPEAPTTVPVPNFVNRAPDVSNLRRPIQLGVEGVPQILRCMQSATKEITDVLLYECNIIYECKVCLSLFRGLTNLIAHKRAYCEDCHHDNKLDFVNNKPEDETIVVQPVAPPPVTNEWDNYIDSDVESTSSVLGIGENTGQSTVQSVTPQGIQDSLTGRSHAFRFYNAVVERAQKKAQERNLTTLTLSPIKSSSVAVYQDTGSRTRKDDEISTAGSDKGSLDSQKENVIKPSKPLPVKTKVKDIVKTEPAGKKKNLESTSSTIFKLNRFKQVDIQHLMCLKCAKKLSSRRSLLRHMMSLHAIKKVYYLCPLCKKRMTRVDNVVKHLKTHHDKTDEEAMKFRSQVTSKKNSIVVANKLNDSILQTDSDEDASGNSETSGDKKGNFSLNSCEDCGNVFSKAELLQRHCATECKMSNKSKKSSKSMNSSSNKVVKGSKSASIKSTSKSAGVQSSSKSAGVQSTSKQSKGNAGKTSMDKKSKVSIKTEKTIKSNVSIKSESDKSTTKSQPKTTAKSQSEKTTAKSQTEKTTAKSQSENKSGHKSQTATENKTNNKSKTASKVQTDNKANKPATTKSRERSISGIEKWLNKSLDSTSNVTEKDTKSPASSVKSGSAPGTKSASSTAGNKSISTANKQKTTTQVIIDDKQTPKDGAVEGTKSSVKVTAEKCPKYLPGGAGGQDISGSRSDSEKTPRKESDKGARRDSVENVFEKFQKTVSSSPSTENPSSNPQSLDPQTKGKTHGNTESKTQAEQARSKAKDEESVKPKKSASPRGQTALLARDKPNKAGSPLGPEGRDPSPVRTKHSRSHSQGHVTEVKAIKSQESIKGRLSLPAVQMKSQRLRSLVKAKAASCTDETTEVKTESDGTILGKRKRKDELEQRSKVDADPDEISTKLRWSKSPRQEETNSAHSDPVDPSNHRDASKHVYNNPKQPAEDVATPNNNQKNHVDRKDDSDYNDKQTETLQTPTETLQTPKQTLHNVDSLSGNKMDTCENTVDSCVNNSEISSINNAVSDVLCQNLPAVCVSKAGSSPSKQKLVLSDISQSESSEGVTSSNVINESSATSDLENPVKLEVNTNDSSQIKRQDLTAVQRVRPQLSPGSQVSSTVLQSKIVEPHIQIRVLGRKSEKKYKKMVVTVTEAPTPPKLTSSLSVSRHHGLSRHDRTRVASLVDEDTLTCLKCGHKYGSSSNLHRHAVRHLGWRRFKCKLCNLTFFNRSECKRHFRTIHARRMADPGLKPDEFIQQLEPDKIKTQTISMPRVDIAGTKVTASTHDNESSYNISTRKTSRRFDTSPFQRPDYSSKLCTRTGVYEKPRLEILSHQRTRSKSDSVVSAESQTVAPSVKNIDVKTVRDDVVVKPAFSVASMSSLGDITAVQRLQTFESVRTRSSRSVNVPNTLKLESMPSTSLPPNMTNSSLPRPSTLLSESMPSTSVITNVPWKPNTRRSIQTNATKHSGVQIVKKPLLLQHNQGQKSLVQRLGPVSNQPTVELQRLDVATSSGLVSQNTGGVSHNPIVVSQNTGGVSHNPIVVSQNTGGVSHNHVVVSQNTGSVSHNPIVVSQNTGSISHNPIVVSQNTGSISHNHIVVATLPDLQSTSNQKILVKPDPEQVSVTGQIPAVPKHGSITNEITAQLPYSELASRVLTQQPCEVKVMPPRSSDVSGEELAECTDVVTLKNPDGSVFGDIPLNTLPGGATVVGDDIVLLVVNTTDGLSSVDVQPQVQLQTNIQPYTQPHTQPQESLSSVQLAADVQPYARTNIQPYIQPPTEPLLQPITEANIYCGPGSPLLQPSTLEDREVAVVTQRINTRDNRVQTSTIPRETDHSNQSSCPSNQEIAMTVEQVSFATGDEFLQMINEDQRQSNV